MGKDDKMDNLLQYRVGIYKKSDGHSKYEKYNKWK